MEGSVDALIVMGVAVQAMLLVVVRPGDLYDIRSCQDYAAEMMFGLWCVACEDEVTSARKSQVESL